MPTLPFTTKASVLIHTAGTTLVRLTRVALGEHRKCHSLVTEATAVSIVTMQGQRHILLPGGLLWRVACA